MPENPNTIIQALWVGPRLSRMEHLAIGSFLACGHQYHLYSYGDVDNVPAGAVLKDANEIIPASRIFKYRDHDSYAGFSNYFRYTLLLERGGWWVDTDMVCLRPFDFAAEYVFSSQLAAPGDGGGEQVNVGTIKAPAGSPVLQYALRRCLERDPAAIAWGETGPALFAEAVRHCGLEGHVQSAAVFCPIPWFEWTDIINPDRAMRFDEQTCAVHLWNEMWRRGGFDKDDEYDPGCLYQRLQATSAPAGRSRQMVSVAPAPPPFEPAVSSPPVRLADRSSLPTVSAVVLSKNGATRLARCLDSIRRTGFADELVVCVDADTTDDSFAVARRFTTQVHVVATAGYLESALERASSLCSGDFILRVDDDESLGGHWDKSAFQLLVHFNNISHLWVPRRWLVPGDSFIADAPWFPDPQLRLYVNDRGRLTWPAAVHEPFAVTGRSLVLFDRWLNHHVLIDRPRGERRRRCEEYQRLNPRLDSSVFYLYEDLDYVCRPASTTAIDAARPIPISGLSVGHQYTVGSPLDFTTAGTAIEYVGSGWGQPESWGTWTVGPRAEITFPLDTPLEQGGVLTANVVPYLPPGYPTLSATIRYRDNAIGEWLFDREGPTSCSVSIPGDVIGDDPSPSFTFDVPDARSPEQAGESMDARLLALGFQSLRLERLNGTAPRQAATVVGGDKVGSIGRLLTRRPDPREVFIERATRIGRRVLPCTDIEVLWDDMWIFRVGRHYFPVPEAVAPEGAIWESLAGLAATCLHDAHDYWFHRYQPRAGDVIVDIGAGRGEDTLAFSRAVGAGGRVFALEPHPVSFATLQKFCALNGLSNVTALNLACVDAPGRLHIESLPNWQSNSVRDGSPGTDSLAVDGVPFDSVWGHHDIGRIDFLKMNIEGGERLALPGCQQALGHTRHVCIAAHDFRADRGEGEWYRTGDLVRQALTEAGFQVTPRDDARPWARDHIHGARSPKPGEAS